MATALCCLLEIHNIGWGLHQYLFFGAEAPSLTYKIDTSINARAIENVFV